MQNPWFPDNTDAEVIRKYREDQEYHRKLLSRTMSGYRLSHAFGSAFWRIHWDNVATDHANEASAKTEVDMNHVEALIEKIRPDLILTFGQLAMETINRSIYAKGVVTMSCHHPNARHKTQADLDQFAINVLDYERNYERR